MPNQFALKTQLDVLSVEKYSTKENALRRLRKEIANLPSKGIGTKSFFVTLKKSVMHSQGVAAREQLLGHLKRLSA